MSKEPGQLAYESLPSHIKWGNLDEGGKQFWAAVESAIRADERAKVIEECAKLADEQAEDEPYGHAKFRCFHIAAAIRAKIGAEHG